MPLPNTPPTDTKSPSAEPALIEAFTALRDAISTAHQATDRLEEHLKVVLTPVAQGATPGASAATAPPPCAPATAAARDMVHVTRALAGRLLELTARLEI